MVLNRASAAGAPATAAAATEEWDEERIEAALQRLKDLHIQLRNLRTGIPRIIEPMSTDLASPEALFSAFKESTKTVTKEIADFKALVLQDDTKQTFDHAKQSRKENPKGIKQWRARDDPDWLTLDPS